MLNPFKNNNSRAWTGKLLNQKVIHLYCLSSFLEKQVGSVNRCRIIEGFVIISDH